MYYILAPLAPGVYEVRCLWFDEKRSSIPLLWVCEIAGTRKETQGGASRPDFPLFSTVMRESTSHLVFRSIHQIKNVYQGVEQASVCLVFPIPQQTGKCSSGVDVKNNNCVEFSWN